MTNPAANNTCSPEEASREAFEAYWRERQKDTYFGKDCAIPGHWRDAFKPDAWLAWQASRRAPDGAREAEFYELLLAKYMEHVGAEEGTVFLGCLQHGSDGLYHGWSDKVSFNAEEFDALEKASNIDAVLAAKTGKG